MSAQFAIFVLGVLLVVGWFALGTHLNVRKGHRYMEWLQGGLPLLGEKTTLRWLGSSVVHLTIQNAHEPFRRAEVLVILEPRDVPPLWLLARLRGRRDLLIVRTELRAAPRTQVEILHRDAWSTRAVEREVKQLHWQLVPLPDQPFRVYALQLGASPANLVSAAGQSGLELVRLGARRPNHSLEVHWRLPARPASSSRTALETVQHLAGQI
jgi:hypothetical protein